MQGQIISLSRNILTRNIRLTIELATTDSNVVASYEKDKLYEIAIGAIKKKRSLDANAYFHMLVGKVADRINCSKPFVKNHFIGMYGQQELIDGKLMTIKSKVDPQAMMEREDIHLSAYGYEYDDDGIAWNLYKVMRPSHTYNTQEFSILLNGVIEDAKELGIETITPQEKERMLALWKASCK